MPLERKEPFPVPCVFRVIDAFARSARAASPAQASLTVIGRFATLPCVSTSSSAYVVISSVVQLV